MGPRLLWVGLGNMGRPMCKNLVEKGNLGAPLLVWNRSPERSVDLSKQLGIERIEVAQSISEGVAKAEIIITCLANDHAVKELVHTMVEGNVKGKLFIDSSTVHPDTTTAVADVIESHGADFVAAPVFGAPSVAVAAQLIAVLCGPKASVDKARPWYKGVMARAEIDLSDKPYSNAAQMKLLGNTFVFNMVEQLAEAHTFSEKLGLDQENVHEFVELFYGKPWSTYSRRMTADKETKQAQPLVSVGLALKDSGYALQLAEGVDMRLGAISVARKHLEDASTHTGPSGDLADIYGAVRAENGLKFDHNE